MTTGINSLTKTPTYRPEPESDSSQWVKLSDKVSQFVSNLFAKLDTYLGTHLAKYLDPEALIPPPWSLRVNYYKNRELDKEIKENETKLATLSRFEKKLIEKGLLDEGSRPSREIYTYMRYKIDSSLCLQIIEYARKWNFTDSTLAALPFTSCIQNYQKNRLLCLYKEICCHAKTALQDLTKPWAITPRILIGH